MEIGNILNTEMRMFLSETQRKENVAGDFQAALEKALAKKDESDEKELREACEAFESYFLQIMFREMRKTTFNEDGIFAKSYAEKIFTDMLDEEISKSLARTGGIGLAEQMLRQMTSASQKI